MNEITRELLAEFKERMKLGDDEDANLTSILQSGIEYLTSKCGAYDIHTSERFKRLLFNYGRYEYNDAFEYFEDNFLSEILALNIENVLSTSSTTVEGEGNEAI